MLFNHVSAQVKRLYIANDDHTDYMWTANEVTYDSAFVHMLDYYLQQIEATQNNPTDFQARFNCDGSYWIKAYEKYRSPQQFNKLVAAIKSGHISSPLNMLVSCYGGQSTESVIRGMYYAGAIERKYKLRFTLAGSMENNTLPLGLASLWAGAGAKYSWKGIGGYGSQMSYAMRATRKHQMYRYNGLDGNGLLIKWYLYNEKTLAPLGGYAECRLHVKYKNLDQDFNHVINTLDKFCDTINAPSIYPYNVAGAFGFGHDDLQTFESPAFINAAKAGTNATRKIRVSNEEDFFKDFEKTYPTVPAQSVSYGNEWDLLCASMNEITAKVKRATEKLRTAEALASVVSLNNKGFANRFKVSRNQAWESYGVYWEHNWTGDGPVSRKERADWQIKKQQQLSSYVDTLYNSSLNQLALQIKQSAVPTFFVFNALAWERNDVADIPYNGIYPVKVVEKLSQKEVASQLITKNSASFLRILAENIPSVGYKVYEIQKGLPKEKALAAEVEGEFISNKFYTLKLSKSGAITELYDKLADNKQLVKVIDGKYVNDLGGTNINDGSNLVVENAGTVSVTLKAVSTNPILHTVRVTLFANNPRIDIEDSIQQNFGDTKTWSFSFNTNNQLTRHEELAAILTVKKAARGGHYADENARYDWQTFNHFADMSEPKYGITLSNMDCSFFKLGKSTVDSLWENSTQINALAGGNIDKKVEDSGVLGILKQNGNKDFLYKFALTTHQSAFDEVKAMKFSLEHQNPLVGAFISGKEKTLGNTSFSLLKVNNPNVLVWCVKPAEDAIDHSYIARFWNLENKNTSTNVHFNQPIKSAWQVSHIETNENQLKPNDTKLDFELKPYQIKTLRLLLTK